MARNRVLACTSLMAALALGGCSQPDDGSFTTQGATPSASCRVHQKEEPGTRYTAGTRADTGAILEMMRSFTSNRDKPFCDGSGPNRIDRMWEDLYARLGGGRGGANSGDAEEK